MWKKLQPKRYVVATSLDVTKALYYVGQSPYLPLEEQSRAVYAGDGLLLTKEEAFSISEVIGGCAVLQEAMIQATSIVYERTKTPLGGDH